MGSSDVQVVKLLLSVGADPLLRDAAGRDAVDHSCSSRTEFVMSTLLSIEPIGALSADAARERICRVGAQCSEVYTPAAVVNMGTEGLGF